MHDAISITVNGQAYAVDTGTSVAAAIAMTSSPVTRISVGSQPRAPLCGMGVCQECRVTINGRPHQLACQTLCEAGMHILCGDYV